MKNKYFITVYRMTTDGLDEYQDEYSGILYDTYEAALPEYYEAQRYFPEGACISNIVVDD